MRILLIAATEAEIAPTLAWLDGFEEDAPVHDRIGVCITGVGLMAAIHAITCAIAFRSTDLVVGAGIAGAFNRALALGECVLVRGEQLADFGAEDGDVFLDAFDMGLVQEDEAPFSGRKLVNPLLHIPPAMAGLRQVDGLTVLKVSGCEPTIAARGQRYGADIETMEGAALHYVCAKMRKPFIQLRAISNYVTRRDRSAWKLPEAVAALNERLLEWLPVALLQADAASGQDD